MPSILIVCTANICRSPVAEALLRDRLVAMEMSDWDVGSAGTWAYPGQSAAEHSTYLLSKQGLDISGHSSRIVAESLLSNVDLVLCMETGHVEALKTEFPGHKHKIHLLTAMSDRHYSVSDPFGGSQEMYENMIAEVSLLIDDGMPQIVDRALANERRRLEGKQGTRGG
jgi:protein-tyrosine-phosphatase